MEKRSFGYRLRTRRRAAGLTQRQLASTSGVKQPLISAIESGHRTPTPAVEEALEQALVVRPSRLLSLAAGEVSAMIAAAGGRRVRVFGSVARGADVPSSDVDLLVAFDDTADIVTVLNLEADLSSLLTTPVDIVSESSSGRVADRARAEAVPL